ncbi:MAG: methyltransferase [Alphaproteobacteria bacterium]
MTGTTASSLNEPVTAANQPQHMANVFSPLLSGLLVRAGVPDALGETPETAQALASRVGVNPDALHRIMFFLASNGIFAYENDRFRHSKQSALLRSDHPQTASSLKFIPPLFRETLAMMQHSLRTGRPGTELFGPDALFGHLSRNSEEAKSFDEFMTARSKGEVAAVLRAYDFSAFSTIADIGGGRGHLIRAVLQNSSKPEGILFDLPHAINPQTDNPTPRLRLVAGDFFKDNLPAADAYLLMNVIHDWDDEKSIALLKNLRKAAPRGSKLFIIGMLMPSEPDLHPVIQTDLIMLLVAGGRERNEAEHRTLLNAAGFKLERVIPTQSPISIFEAVAA